MTDLSKPERKDFRLPLYMIISPIDRPESGLVSQPEITMKNRTSAEINAAVNDNLFPVLLLFIIIPRNDFLMNILLIAGIADYKLSQIRPLQMISKL